MPPGRGLARHPVRPLHAATRRAHPTPPDTRRDAATAPPAPRPPQASMEGKGQGKLRIAPVLLSKGSTRLALYGLGAAARRGALLRRPATPRCAVPRRAAPGCADSGGWNANRQRTAAVPDPSLRLAMPSVHAQATCGTSACAACLPHQTLWSGAPRRALRGARLVLAGSFASLCGWQRGGRCMEWGEAGSSVGAHRQPA